LDQQASTLRWLWDHRVPLIATDNLAVENIPVTPNETYLTQEERDSGVRSPYTGMLHRQLIPLLGIALGELWFLDDLAAECRSTGRWDFMLVAKPLNLVGGVGSPANAVAIT
jgi:kynurenine formamidase